MLISGAEYIDLTVARLWKAWVLILTHGIDTSEFIVYTRYITKESLEKFTIPFKAPLDNDDAAISGLKIEYIRVPIWPILTLQEDLPRRWVKTLSELSNQTKYKRERKTLGNRVTRSEGEMFFLKL
jgi:hypothetical protein